MSGRTRSREVERPAPHTAIAVAFLALAVILGGGGSPNPGTELLLQLVFVAAALAWLWLPARGGAPPIPRSRGFWAICLLVVALPVMQLVPLPADLWTSLPDHGNRAAALALVGEDQGWQPLSHYPSRTLAGLLSIIPALFAFFVAASLDSRGRAWLVGTIMVMAVATALFGALQLSLGPQEAPHLYRDYHRVFLTGFQANRNAAADVLLIGMAATAVFLVPALAPTAEEGERLPARRRAAGVVLAGLALLLFIATILTGSRMGIALIPLALFAGWIVLRPALRDLGPLRHLPPLLAIVAVLSVAFLALRGGNAALGAVVDRFSSTDGRSELWQDAWFIIGNSWPFGVGVGGAQPALIAAERLEVLDPFIPNRVHNDYLELVLEGGLPALGLFAAVALILGWMAVQTWRRKPEDRRFTALGLTILAIAAAHSLVDYPLRSMALACLVGTGAGLLVAAPRIAAASRSPNGPRELDGDLT